jgi:hypothetical protein
MHARIPERYTQDNHQEYLNVKMTQEQTSLSEPRQKHDATLEKGKILKTFCAASAEKAEQLMAC